MSPIRLFLAAAAPALLFAQGGTSLLQQADPLACFTAVETPPGLVVTTVDVTGQSFAKAWRLQTASLASNLWERRLRCYGTKPTVAGDKIVATFWARAVDAPGGLGAVRFVVEEKSGPYSKAAEKTVGLSAQWRKFDVAFTAPSNYDTAGSYNLSFWVNFQLQTIEIGGFQILDYGPGVSFSQLNLSNWPYEGAADGSAWRTAALDRIEQIRKRDFAFVVRHPSGAPLANERVRLRMKAHRFGFGTAVAACRLPGAPSPCGTAAERTDYARVLLGDFNKAVLENDLKWDAFERDNGARAGFALNWLRDNGITSIRGHNLVWPNRQYLPGDLTAMIDSANLSGARTRILEHITQLMAFTTGKTGEWDVLNEPYHNSYLQDAFCPGNRSACPEMAAWFNRARQGDASSALYVNEYDIIEGGYDFAAIEGFAAIVSSIKAAAPLNGIGLQGHFSSDLTGPERVLQILDQYAARFGLPMQITEFDVNTADEDLQARYTRDILIAAFSHPSINGFLNWGFWEGQHWIPRAAMYRQNWTRKPNGDAWRDLIFSQWWTNQTAAADASGVVRFRGFFGDYEVVNENDGTPLGTLAVNPGTVSVTVDTSPSSLKILVDGQEFTAPQVFQWTPGSAHTLEAKSPQGLVPQIFDSWSQGGARAQSVTTPTANATYTATFTEGTGAGGTADPPVILEPTQDQTINVAGVTLRWTREGSARDYELRAVNASTGATVFTGKLAGAASTQTLITFANGSYRFFVRACATQPAGRVCTAESERRFRVELPAPASAPSITAPAAGAVFTGSTQTFQWTAAAGAQNYDVELATAAGVVDLRIAVPAPTLSTIYSMRGGDYRLRVRACSAACGPWSAQTAFTVNLPAVPTTAPTITATDISPTNVLITYFTAVPGADLYRILAIQTGSGPGGGALTVASTTTAQTQGTMRLPAGAVRVVVAGCNGNGCGPFSESVAVNPPIGNPAAPTLSEPVPGAAVPGPTVLFSWTRVPGDNGSNTLYRLYVQDLSRQAAALDVLTTANFYGAGFRAEGARYDATVIANPGPSQVQGPAVGFSVRGSSPASPLVVQPRHESTLPGGNVQVAWTPVAGANLYQYYVAVQGESAATASGVTPGLLVQAPLPGSAAGTRYSATVRACQAAACAPDSDAGWGPWSISGGTGVSNFTLTR